MTDLYQTRVRGLDDDASRQPSGDPLREALLDSRARWRDLVRISTDFAFETDACGCFVFLSPDSIIGRPAATLLGESGAALLASAGDDAAFNPFVITAPIRDRRVWLRREDGNPCWMSISAVPLLDAAGEVLGVRGSARDVTELDRTEAAMARELRRSELVDHILWYMRTEIMAPRMIQRALQALMRTLGADGAMIVDAALHQLVPEHEAGHGIAPCTENTDFSAFGPPPELLHEQGGDNAAVRRLATRTLAGGIGGPALQTSSDGHGCMVCATPTRFDGCPGLVLWRAPGGRDWEADDLSLVAATIGTIRVLLELGSVQQEMARQARTDALTGLFNRRAFVEEVTRRLDRLERDRLPGSLLFVDLDNFKTLNDQRGHAAGDEGLRVLADLLRDATRPGDVVARLGGDEFALWFDGMDHLAAAERAERVRLQGKARLGELGGEQLGLSLSIGIATRWPDSGLDADALLRRADEAMYAAKSDGKGRWRLWRETTDNAR